VKIGLKQKQDKISMKIPKRK